MFRIDLQGIKIKWDCHLSWVGNQKQGRFDMEINGTPVRELERAPPVEKANLPPVCQSTSLIFDGELTNRVTF